MQGPKQIWILFGDIGASIIAQVRLYFECNNILIETEWSHKREIVGRLNGHLSTQYKDK